jgi:putative oxidoreductase
MNGNNAYQLSLLIVRGWIGIMIFAHGYRHLKSVRSGPGMANWFESLGLRNGPLQAWNVTITELAFGPLLLAGLLTPLAYAGCASIVLVALVTNHWKNGFFINSPGEGWEYVGTVAVLCIALAGVGPGNWSLDHALKISFPFLHGRALLIALVVAVGGTIAFLATFWRPPVKTQSEG